MNVVICDDHRLFSDALASVLAARSWTIVSCAVDPAHAVAAVASHRVHACLMDLTFPEGDIGIEGIRSIHETSPDTMVVVLTATGDPQLIMRAVQSGADAILFKDTDIDEIVDIVERTGRGAQTKPTISAPTDNRRPASSTPARSGDDLLRFLTKRERDVLQHMIRGESGRQLAEGMNISYSTARSHVQNILAKLGVHSRLEVLALAVEHDLCRPRTFADPA